MRLPRDRSRLGRGAVSSLEAYQSGGNRRNPQPLLRPQSIEPTRATLQADGTSGLRFPCMVLQDGT